MVYKTTIFLLNGEVIWQASQRKSSHARHSYAGSSKLSFQCLYDGGGTWWSWWKTWSLVIHRKRPGNRMTGLGYFDTFWLQIFLLSSPNIGQNFEKQLHLVNLWKKLLLFKKWAIHDLFFILSFHYSWQ